MNVSPVLDPSTISLDHAWWLPERDPEDNGNGCFDTYISNANVVIEAGCGESGFGNNCKSHMCRVYKCEPEEIIGDTDMQMISERFAMNEELV